MKTRFKILIINVLVLFMAWILIGELGQAYLDNLSSDNVFNKLLSAIRYTCDLFLIISSLIFFISILGTIIFGLIKKKKELFLGFLYSLILNLILGLTLYLT